MTDSYSAKQRRFVAEWLADKSRNATQAAIRAGFSEKTAYSQAGRMLKMPKIIRLIEAEMSRLTKELDTSAERILREMAHMAFWDPADLVGVEVVDEEGNIKIDGIHGPLHIKVLPEEIRRAIVGWSWDKNNNFTLKLADKSKALDQLARHRGLYNDKLDVNINEGIADRLDRAERELDDSDG